MTTDDDQWQMTTDNDQWRMTIDNDDDSDNCRECSPLSQRHICVQIDNLPKIKATTCILRVMYNVGKNFRTLRTIRKIRSFRAKMRQMSLISSI